MQSPRNSTSNEISHQTSAQCKLDVSFQDRRELKRFINFMLQLILHLFLFLRLSYAVTNYTYRIRYGYVTFCKNNICHSLPLHTLNVLPCISTCEKFVYNPRILLRKTCCLINFEKYLMSLAIIWNSSELNSSLLEQGFLKFRTVTAELMQSILLLDSGIHLNTRKWHTLDLNLWL